MEATTTTSTRPARTTDTEEIVALSLAAWGPVFESFRSILGDRL